MIKEELDENKESTDKAEDKDEPICSFEECVFDFLKRQVRIDEEVFIKLDKTMDFVIKLSEFIQKTSGFLIKHNDYIQKVFEFVTELEDKNKILEKEVTLLRKELDELKSQGK